MLYVMWFKAMLQNILLTSSNHVEQAAGLVAVGMGLLAALCVNLWHRGFDHTHRSTCVAAFLTVLRMLGVGPFRYSPSPEAIMPLVASETNLHDFDDLSFLLSYSRACALMGVTTFTAIGHVMAVADFRLHLTRRLHVINYLKYHPEVSAVPITQPIFVFGLGRSGTSFLHRLLSLDPKSRAPKLWELSLPTPAIDLDTTSSAAEWVSDRSGRRAYFDQDVQNLMFWLGVGAMERFHEIGTDLPEECFLAMTDELPFTAHYLPSTLQNWDRLRDILPSSDFVRAYEWYKKILQLLSFQTTGEHAGESGETQWVLKCPSHLFMLPELCKVFPDAKLIWTHRHPVPTVSSLCSIITAMRGMYFDISDLIPAELGQAVCRVVTKAIEQAPRDIASSGRPCAHVLFEQLIADPIQTVKDIYEQFHMEYTVTFDAAIKAYLVENSRQRADLLVKLSHHTPTKVLHDHKPEDFGLSTQSLSQGCFQEYITKYKITSAK